MLSARQLIQVHFHSRHKETIFKDRNHTTQLNELSEYVANNNIGKLSFTEQVYIFYHCLGSAPLCGCGNPRVFKSFVKGYTQFCSNRQCCFRRNSISSGVSAYLKNRTRDELTETNLKRLQTSLQRYGTTHPMKNGKVVDKVQATNIARYGTKCTLENDLVKEQIQKTNLSRYGSKNPLSNTAIQEKVKKTNLEKYGTEYSVSSWCIREKIVNTVRSKYGVDNVLASKTVQEKIKNTVRHRYNVGNVSQAHIPALSIKILECKHTLALLYETKNTQQIAAELSVSRDTVVEYLHRHGLEIKHTTVSNFHLEVEQYINSLGVTTKRNVRLCDNLEIDIFVEDLNLGIECNGTYWHSELNGKDKHYHLNKKDSYKQHNIDIVYVWEHDWYRNRLLIESRILARLHKAEKIYARKCKIQEISSKQADEFLTRTHLQGTCASSHKLGLFYQDKLVSVMTFGNCRFGKIANYELLRFSSELGTVVVGAAGKLFAYFTKKCAKGTKIVSYCDKDFNSGNVYRKIGFKEIKHSLPGYVYTKNYRLVYNRMHFQKKKLGKVLPNYQGHLSEWENMQINGYDRLWNCGNIIFSWENDK